MNGLFFAPPGSALTPCALYDFATTKHSRGFRNYVKIILRNYFSYQPVSMEVDGKRQPYFSVTLANAGQFGNGAYIAPGASPDDGYLDCAMILPHPRYRFAELAWRLMGKKLADFPYFRTSHLQTGYFAGISDKRIHIDGESVMLETNTVQVGILAKALKVITV
ncbi:MAG: hypothetical protein LRY55_06375 [Leadbetterella sp.]|nr:hypothetical protein [Leadbetterella sp.]